MKRMTAIHLPLLLVAALATSPAFADAKKDEAARELATKSGCFICHAIELDAKGPEGLKPVGPPWKAVAARYKGDKTARKNLTTAVMGGTSVYNRHWKEESSGVAMPPNGVAISEADARKLVDWILSLAK
ncbi:MAG: c-type cytochrome [Sulfuritalea sp.]|nr:c-type cytochrome [Sulfuritalea sp.]MDP1984412.1 c-type cytochrome [Sulfuritalea sp.]